MRSKRKTEFCHGERLGAHDHLMRWEKPKARPQWMSAEQYRAYPGKLTVREVNIGGLPPVGILQLPPGGIFHDTVNRAAD